MATINTYVCDTCQTQKNETNHWWKVYLLDADSGPSSIGVLILPWDINSISKPLSRTELLPETADAHLCGRTCLFEWVSKKGLNS